MKKITSLQNNIVKQTADLQIKKYRTIENKFVVEGFKSVIEALKSDFQVISIFLCVDNLDKDSLFFLLHLGEEKNVEFYDVTENIIKKISDTKTPQPVLAVVQQKNFSFSDILDKDNNFIIILDEVQDSGNLGTIIRTADAANISAVILTKNCVDFYAHKTIRSTMGSCFHLPVIIDQNPEDIIFWLREQKYDIFSTDLNAERNLYNIDFTGKKAVVMGSESHGVSKVFLENSDLNFYIPMLGKAESLNVSVASSLIIYQARVCNADIAK